MNKFQSMVNKISPFSGNNGALSMITFALPFAYSVLSWLVLFISTAVSQHKSKNRDASSYAYHFSGHQLYSFVWWALFFQLFVYALMNGVKFGGFVTRDLAMSLTVIGTIQAIIIADRYIYSYYSSEKAICAGAILIAVSNFLWLHTLSTVANGADVSPNGAAVVTNDIEKNAGTGTNYGHNYTMSQDTAIPENTNQHYTGNNNMVLKENEEISRSQAANSNNYTTTASDIPLPEQSRAKI